MGSIDDPRGLTNANLQDAVGKRAGQDQVESDDGSRKVVAPAGGMAVGHAVENVLEVDVGFAVIELGGGDQRADDGPAIGAAIGTANRAIGRMARSTVSVSSSI